MSAREELRALLLDLSVKRGDFTLASGAKSDFYVDCRNTTIHARGALLIGELGFELVHSFAKDMDLFRIPSGGLP